MARYPQPTTDEELESAKAEIDDLRKAVSDALAEDLGAEPEDYDATRQPVVDGGESLTLRWLHTYRNLLAILTFFSNIYIQHAVCGSN